jgi:membrane-bound ClpP family serine protease
MHWLLGITLFLLGWLIAKAIRALGQRPLLGPEGMVGTLGIARTDIAPEGQVEARGARWRARTQGPSIAKGSRIKISSTSGLTLIVEVTDARGAAVPSNPPAAGLATGIYPSHA